MNHGTKYLITVLALCVGTKLAQAQQTESWRYYRVGNTGIQGDFNEAICVGPDGDPWVGGYDPFFEEGDVAKFVQIQDHWVNVSNVDYPGIGHPNDTGSARVTDIVPDGSGNLWLGTWRGALRFDPSVGPSSIVRYDETNSPLIGGRTVDVTLAPGGQVRGRVEQSQRPLRLVTQKSGHHHRQVGSRFTSIVSTQNSAPGTTLSSAG